MIKKILEASFLLSVVLIPASAHAQWEYNWLVGASTGYGQSKGHVNYFIFDTNSGAVAKFAREHKNNAWLAGLLAGYQARCNGWVVGGEVSFDWTKRHEIQNFYTAGYLFTTTTTRDPILAFTGRIGREIYPCFLPYLKAGIETIRNKLDINAQFLGVPRFDIEANKRTYNYVVGIGAEMPILPLNGLSFRLEYDYHAKGKAVSVDGFTTAPPVLSTQGDYKPKAYTGKISLVYNFI